MLLLWNRPHSLQYDLRETHLQAPLRFEFIKGNLWSIFISPRGSEFHLLFFILSKILVSLHPLRGSTAYVLVECWRDHITGTGLFRLLVSMDTIDFSVPGFYAQLNGSSFLEKLFVKVCKSPVDEFQRIRKNNRYHETSMIY